LNLVSGGQLSHKSRKTIGYAVDVTKIAFLEPDVNLEKGEAETSLSDSPILSPFEKMRLTSKREQAVS
jgi:hypothetical protein